MKHPQKFQTEKNIMNYSVIIVFAIILLLTNIVNAQSNNIGVNTYHNDKYSLPIEEPLFANSENISPAMIELNSWAVKQSILGRNKEAITAFRKVLASVPGDLPQVRNSLAITLANNGEYEESIAILKDIINKNPDYAAAYSNLGDTLYKSGEIADVIALYRKALSLKPKSVIIMMNLGTSLFDEKQYQEALKWFDETLLIDPNYPMAHNNRGVVLLTVGQNKEALKSLNRAVEIDPKFSDAFNNLGITLSKIGKKKESQRAFHKAVEIRPNWSQALYNLGLSYIENKNRDDAYQVLSKLNNLDEKLAINLKKNLWQKFVKSVK